MVKETKIFINQVVDKKQLKQLMGKAFADFGMMKAAYLAHQLKDLGFHYATKAGLSLSIEDLRVPSTKKNLISLANKKVDIADFEVSRGNMTEVERFQNVIHTWTTTSESLKDQVVSYFRESDPLNSVYMMAFSGARGNLSQVRQLVGMRGLMADPNGQIIDLPIVANFREGLTVTDYIISSYGARKGLVDTALRTADSGYLTRRLIDVAQDVVTREKRCNAEKGFIINKVVDANTTLISLWDRTLGRVLAKPLYEPISGKLIANKNEEITPEVAKKMAFLNIESVTIRSPLTCSSSRDVCQECYGWNLAYGNLIDLGEAIGIIAAQSIGEPGTQLTMRTFHTGGVFTTEPSRQIRASCSGKIHYSPTLKTQKTRTSYGEVAYQSKNESSLVLIDYNNKELILDISSNTLILVKNKSYVKKDDILYELSSKTIKRGGEQVFKHVYARQSGEIIVENNKSKKPEAFKNLLTSKNEYSLLWVLGGEVFNVPLTSTLKIQAKSLVRKDQTLAETLSISTSGGLIRFPQKKTKENNGLHIHNHPISYESSKLYIEKQEKESLKTVVYGKRNRKINFFSLEPFSVFDESCFFCGYLSNTKYLTKTGGRLYSNTFLPKKKSSKTKKKRHGTVFYLPESTYEIDPANLNFDAKNGDFLEKKSSFFKNKPLENSGFVEISENKKGFKNLVLKLGKRILVTKDKKWKSYHKTILYPGETLLNQVTIQNLSYSEIRSYNKKSFLCLFPIVRYEIINDPNELLNFSFSSFFEPKASKYKNLPLELSLSPILIGNTPFQLLKHQVLSQDLVPSKELKLKIDLLSLEEKKEEVRLKLHFVEAFVFKNNIPKEVNEKDLVFSKLVNNSQYVEPYTKIASFQVLIQNENKIVFIKEQYLGNEKKILLNTEKNYKTIFVDQAKSFFYAKKLVKEGEKNKSNFISTYAGLVNKISGDCLHLHLGIPYLFSPGAVLGKRSGDLIKEGESLGQLIYERARTGDIVQGLPKVERVLEARKPKVEAVLAKHNGTLNYMKQHIHVVQSTGNLVITMGLWLSPSRKDPVFLKNKHKYDEDLDLFHHLPLDLKVVIGKGEFVTVGQPLNDALVNPHTLLKTYYFYYRHMGVRSGPNLAYYKCQYQCAYSSFRKIQALFLNSVQSVYYSQGVYIGDKHVEIILKQMTNKVEVTSPKDTQLVAYESIKLHQAHYVNSSLDKRKEKAVYEPVLLGITKASLRSTSFISAASFQQTTRVLTEAAILGKVDWLQGLKENVIVGRLIPTGTGLNSHIDISYMKTKVSGKLRPNSEELSSEAKNKKEKDLKNRIKFKFAS